jgi:hypothetical protein
MNARRGAPQWTAGGNRRRDAAASLRAEGVPVVLLHATLLPNEETALLLYEGPSGSAIRALHERAGLSFERMTHALHVGSVVGERTRTEDEGGPS